MPAKKILLTSLVICLSFVLFAGCSLLRDASAEHHRLLSLPDHSKTSLTFHDKRLSVEVVNTQASTMQGLSDRTEIGSDAMLFMFNDSSYQQFWMKDMQFNLDFVWLNNMKVVDLTENVPKPFPGEVETQLPVYSPKKLVNEVMELPAGEIKTRQIKLGDTFVPSE